MCRLTVIIYEGNFIVAHEPIVPSEHLWELEICSNGYAYILNVILAKPESSQIKPNSLHNLRKHTSRQYTHLLESKPEGWLTSVSMRRRGLDILMLLLGSYGLCTHTIGFADGRSSRRQDIPSVLTFVRCSCVVGTYNDVLRYRLTSYRALPETGIASWARTRGLGKEDKVFGCTLF